MSSIVEVNPTSSDASSPRLIVVMGATGTGKTKLAVEVAREIEATFGQRCEILNADVMQCYEGCPIVTNKATVEEQSSIPHHLMGFADPSQDMKMPRYRAAAEELLGEMRSRGSLPLVVGGSDYYVKSLICRQFDPSKAQEDAPEQEGKQNALTTTTTIRPTTMATTDEAIRSSSSCPSSSFKDLSDEGAYKKLQEIDPVSATRLHPNNIRRIRRYLEMYESTGVLPSLLFKKQRLDTRHRGTLLYNCLIFFLDAEDEVLSPHLRSRVDDMVERGMVQELTNLYESKLKAASASCPAQTDHGIYQAIGVKEFREAFSITEATKRVEAIERGLEEMKRNTIKLAKKQRRRMTTWMSEQDIAYHTVDMTSFIKSKSQTQTEQERKCIWKQHLLKAMDRVRQWMQGGRGSSDSPAAAAADDDDQEEQEMKQWRAWRCEICKGKILRGPAEWEAHLKSRAHRKRRVSIRKRNKDFVRTEEQEDKQTNLVTLKIITTKD